MPFLTTNHGLRAFGEPKALTSTIISKKFGVRSRSGRQERYVMEVSLEFPCLLGVKYFHSWKSSFLCQSNVMVIIRLSHNGLANRDHETITEWLG